MFMFNTFRTTCKFWEMFGTGLKTRTRTDIFVLKNFTKALSVSHS